MCSVQNPSLQFWAENSLAERRKGKQQNLILCWKFAMQLIVNPSLFDTERK